ncbi:MAG: hypothetical protein E2O39_10525 [Planctomycetota bacterium]|nr:MAG: hypothetical protein E2O39_10525 [Planctomycetota bacterium]
MHSNQLDRSQVIDNLRIALIALTDDEHSICEVAERLDIFCGGFAQWTFTELKQRYPTIVRSRPRITPQELRELANRWQLARQSVMGTKLACDTQSREGRLRTCRGWDEWSDDDLARFHADLCHEEVEIDSGETAGGAGGSAEPANP